MATNARGTGPLTEAVAAQLRAQLGLRKWKQADLSRASGIPKATLSSLLSGNRTIDLDQMARMAEAFGRDPGDIVRAATGHAPLDGNYYTANPKAQGVPATEDHMNGVAKMLRESEEGE